MTKSRIRFAFLLPIGLWLVLHGPAGWGQLVQDPPATGESNLDSMLTLIHEARLSGFTYQAIEQGLLALELAANTQNHEARAQISMAIAQAYHEHSEFASALQYYLQALKEYEDLGANSELGRVNTAVGHLFSDWDALEKALEYYLDGNRFYYEAQDDTGIVETLYSLAFSYEKLMNYGEAIGYYEALLSIYRGNDNKTAAVATLDKISNLYERLDQHPKALEYELRILEVNQELQDSVEISKSLNNIGYYYKYLGKYELALQYFERSLEMDRDLGELRENDEDVTLLNLGIIYRSMGDKRSALSYLYQALRKNVEKGDKLQMAKVYSEISKTYVTFEEYEEAIPYAETSLGIAKSEIDPEFLLQNYKELFEVYQKIGDDRNALKHYMQFVSVRDSLLAKQNRQEQQLLQKQLEIERMEKELKLLLVDKEIRDLELNELKLSAEKKEAEIGILTREKELQVLSLRNQQAEKESAQQELLLSHQRFETERKDQEIVLLQKDKRLRESEKELEEKEKQKAIELLHQEKEIQKLQLNRASTIRTIILILSGILAIFLFLLFRSYQSKQRANQALAYQNVEIQKQKDEIEQSYNTVKLLSEIARDITSELSKTQIIEKASHHVGSFMDAAYLGVGLYNHKNDRIEFYEDYSRGKAIPRVHFDMANLSALPVLCFSQQKEIFIQDLQSDYPDQVENFVSDPSNNHCSMVFQPLSVKSKPIGVMVVQSYRRNAYNDHHQYVLGNLAVHIAIALENANTYQEIAEKTEELGKSFENLQKAQAKLVQSEKMASLGLLTAGVAHEINNPINFVYAGVDGLKTSLEGLLEVLEKYGQIDRLADIEEILAILQDIRTTKEDIYFDETKDSIFELVNAIREGASRTAEIVNGLRNFSRLDETERKKADIHKGLDSSILLLNNKIKKQEVRILKDYDPALPKITCYPGQLNQVFMNILSNAIDAVDTRGEITVTTRMEEENAFVSIRDNGVGMNQEVKERIFDPFYSTKDLGKGTGLGLSISFGIIEKHQGSIEVQSELGKGSEFTISLPTQAVESITVS